MTSPETSEELAKYRDRVGCSMFYNDRIDEMSRDDLLRLIGWMMADKESTVTMRDNHLNFMHDIYKLRSGQL